MAVRDDFSAGEVLAAADLNDTFASKVDYALPTNAQTGTAYTFVAADAEKLTTASNGSAVTLTIPPASSVAWPDNTVLRVVNYGAGAVTIDGGSGVTVTNTASTIAQYGAAVAIRTGSDAWTVVPFGGGDVPSATVSSPAATGQYTDSGTTYDYYTFTASGTLTVDTAGFADILVVGGGGGGGSGYGGGGGAGGFLEVTDAYLPAGSLTVTVGAGGSGTKQGTSTVPTQGNNGFASLIQSYVSPGGGGGGSYSRNNASIVYGTRGLNGASGGGSSADGAGSAQPAGVGITNLGNDGGQGVTGNNEGGGGGGAGAAGGDSSGTTGGSGGNGSANSFTGSSVTYGGGGGGSGDTTAGTGGTGGGGAGSIGTAAATSGTANTGGGGGGSRDANANAGNGGSGVVIVRVKV